MLVTGICYVLLVNAVLAAPSTLKPDTSLQVTLHVLDQNIRDLNTFVEDVLPNVDTTTMTKSDVLASSANLAAILHSYNESMEATSRLLSQRGVEEDILQPSDEELNQRYVSVLKQDLERFALDDQEQLGLVLGERFGADGVRMRILAGLLRQLNERVKDAAHTIAEVAAVQDSEGEAVILANLLTDLTVDVAVLNNVFEAIASIYDKVVEPTDSTNSPPRRSKRTTAYHRLLDTPQENAVRKTGFQNVDNRPSPRWVTRNRG